MIILIQFITFRGVQIFRSPPDIKEKHTHLTGLDVSHKFFITTIRRTPVLKDMVFQRGGNMIKIEMNDEARQLPL